METTGIRFIDALDLEGKRVFIRCDFNVPLTKAGRISDPRRIEAALPTIEHALHEGATVILASHLGRPKGKVQKKAQFKGGGRGLGQIFGARSHCARRYF